MVLSDHQIAQKECRRALNRLPSEETRPAGSLGSLGFNPFLIILKNDQSKGTERVSPPSILI